MTRLVLQSGTLSAMQLLQVLQSVGYWPGDFRLAFKFKNSSASWGRVSRKEQHIVPIDWRSEAAAIIAGKVNELILPYGQGRSYGDVCLNDDGVLLSTYALNKFIAFNRETGELICEAGVTFADIITVCLPAGWFPPVTPGTKFVSVGGALANDVHGKNHHVSGTFGCHVLEFQLVRSGGEMLYCSPTENSELFRATIGGLGLTGLITWVRLQLKPVASDRIVVETLRLKNLDDFFAKNSESDRDFDYTVTWVDCLARGDSLGRGLLMRGRHASKEEAEKSSNLLNAKMVVPFDMPQFLLNGSTMRLFNTAFYKRMKSDRQTAVSAIDPFFYPLDAIGQWNRLYGSRGFFQFQFVVPKSEAGTIGKVLEMTSEAGMGSFLVVLKEFGDLPSPGMISFPMPGYTLALDFANEGARTTGFLKKLEDVVVAAGGRIYPAKDALMTPATFAAGFPGLDAFMPLVDKGFSSNFWRRMNKK